MRITSRTWIVLGGITIPTPAVHTDHLDEWLDGPETRGEDVKVPFVDGEHPVEHHLDARTITTRVTILADDDDGVPAEDPELGLLANLDACVAAWTAEPPGLVPVEVHRADGTVFEGEVRVHPNFSLVRSGESFRLVVRCRLPAGVLTEAGS